MNDECTLSETKVMITTNQFQLMTSRRRPVQAFPNLYNATQKFILSPGGRWRRGSDLNNASLSPRRVRIPPLYYRLCRSIRFVDGDIFAGLDCSFFGALMAVGYYFLFSYAGSGFALNGVVGRSLVRPHADNPGRDVSYF